MKKPFKVLTTAALLGTLALTSVGPTAFAAESGQQQTQQNTLASVVVDNGNGLFTLSLENYFQYNQAKYDFAKPGNLKYIVSSKGDFYDLDTYNQFYAAKGDPSKVISALAQKPEFAKTVNAKKGTVKDGKLVEAEQEGPKVESVSAITTTTVDVAIAAPKEDVLGATVVVKDGKGNVVETNSTDISAGDKVASFTFKTAVKTEDLTGVWTVDGKEYNFDAIKQLKAITDAASATPLNEVKLLSALNTAGIKNLDDNKLKAYAVAIVDANPESLADVQKAIDKANKASNDDASKAAAVKAVEEATNQIQFLSALNTNFDRVNADWIGAYTAGKASTNPGTETDAKIGFVIKSSKTDANKVVVANNGSEEALSFDAIQSVIDEINATQVAASYDKAFKSLKATDVSAARTEANAYLPTAEKAGDFDAKVYANDSLDILDALIRVNNATTNNSLKTALVSLDNLENTLVAKYKNNAYGVTITDDFDIKAVNDNLLADYRKAISEQTDVTKKNQRKDIDAIIKKANRDASTALITAVKTEANATTVDADKLVKALQNLGLKQVATSNKETYKVNIGYKTVADADAAQALVNADNIAAIKALKNAGDADKLITALNVIELKNVKPENKAAYVTSAGVTTGGGTSIGQSTNVTQMQQAVDAVNKAEGIKAAVEAINKAETATQVKTALDTLADNGELTDYLDVTPSDRIFIAEHVLDARNQLTEGDRNPAAVAKEFFDAAEIDAAVTEATDARTGTLIAVNNLEITDSLTTIANSLLLVGHESLTGKAGSVTKLGAVTAGTVTSNDTAVANKFITSVKFGTDGKITPQFRSISAVRDAITNAVK